MRTMRRRGTWYRGLSDLHGTSSGLLRRRKNHISLHIIHHSSFTLHSRSSSNPSFSRHDNCFWFCLSLLNFVPFFLEVFYISNITIVIIIIILGVLVLFVLYLFQDRWGYMWNNQDWVCACCSCCCWYYCSSL